VEDLVFTIGPGTVTGYWVRTWRANDDERVSPPRSESRNQTNLGPCCRIEHHSTNAASVRSFGERETVQVTIPEALGEDARRAA
jgi:hypothetical protein